MDMVGSMSSLKICKAKAISASSGTCQLGFSEVSYQTISYSDRQTYLHFSRRIKTAPVLVVVRLETYGDIAEFPA